MTLRPFLNRFHSFVFVCVLAAAAVVDFVVIIIFISSVYFYALYWVNCCSRISRISCIMCSIDTLCSRYCRQSFTFWFRSIPFRFLWKKKLMCLMPNLTFFLSVSFFVFFFIQTVVKVLLLFIYLFIWLVIFFSSAVVVILPLFMW